MRNVILFVLLSISRLPAAAGINPQVDKRVEILSIVARLAGYAEYNDKMAVEYVSAIHAYFDRFSTDSLILFARDIRAQSGISFDAVMTMAVNLQQRGHRFNLQPNWRQDIDTRWTDHAARRFVRLLNGFYSKSQADLFFAQQATYYAGIIKAFGDVVSGFNQSWYASYYGVKPKDDFNVVVGCGNGGSNYGPSITNRDGSKKVFAIMGSWSFNGQRVPVFLQENYLPTLVHEFNHSFINPSVERYTNNALLRSSMQTILDTMRADMEGQAYKKWETVLIESLVRASVIRYMIAQNNVSVETVENEMMDQLNRGFIWTRDLVALLGVYESDREKYPAITDFYPVIIDFFKRTSDNISQSKIEHEAKLPRVVAIDPLGLDDVNVDTTITTLTIRFNAPMIGNGYSFVPGELGKDGDPITEIIGYNNEKTALRVTVKLKPGKQYEVVMTGRSFINTRGYRLRRQVIRFKTRGDENEATSKKNLQFN